MFAAVCCRNAADLSAARLVHPPQMGGEIGRIHEADHAIGALFVALPVEEQNPGRTDQAKCRSSA